MQRLPQVTASVTGQWHITADLARAINSASRTLTGIGDQCIDAIRDFLTGATAPVRFFLMATDWTDVREAATTIAGELSPAALGGVDYRWQGTAAEAYKAIIKPQSDAAARIGVIADKTQSALTWSAAAACAFYLGILAVVIQFIVAFIGVLAELGTVVFSWAGILLACEQAGIGMAELGTLAALFIAAMASQGIQLNNLYSEAADATAFPSKHWPNPFTDRYADGTVTDGDADWSIEN